MTSRLRVCFAAPGHSLVSTGGSVRNVLATAEALSEAADVTLAFRNVLEPVCPGRYRIEEIAPAVGDGLVRDDVAARGLNPFSHLAYLRILREYARRSAGRFDLVLEKGWRLSGFLSRAFAAYGVESILIENHSRAWNETIRSPRALAKYAVHCAAQAVAGHCSRRLKVVAAETSQLKAALVATRGIAADRITVVPLGVDHAVFHPRAMSESRADLGLAPGVTVMLYVGGMDQYHNLSPLLQALREVAPAELELHLVGDGEYRSRYEQLATGSPVKVVFHGQVPHQRVPVHISAADLCLAPYHTSGFHNDEVAFSTLKIPEYMACERPVISVPSGNIRALITDGVTGFLFNNTAASWSAFLARMPDRASLAAMGRVAGPAVAHLDWRATARRYLEMAASPGVGARSGRRGDILNASSGGREDQEST